jgi:hypothetical protein
MAAGLEGTSGFAAISRDSLPLTSRGFRMVERV